jgi:hypothetical protein
MTLNYTILALQLQEMNIGDKVRVVHGRESGVVVGFGPKGVIEVMLSDGFKIPFAKSDLVVVSALEDKVFALDPTLDVPKSTPFKAQSFSDKGIFLAKTVETDGKHTFHLVNNTDFQLLFTTFLLRASFETKPLLAGTLNKKTSIQVFQTEQTGLLDEAKLLVQMLFFAVGRSEVRLPLTKEIELKPNKWKAELDTLPVIERKGTKIQLDISLNENDAHSIANSLGEKIPVFTQSMTKPASEVDLHIEKLVNDHYTLRAEEKLRYQMRAFETHLEKAVSAGLKEVIYIHGVGNGILKAEIGRKLSTNIFVKQYEDARRDKYGYGATLVVLK